MGDLNTTDVAEFVKIVGSDSNGGETTPIGALNDQLKIAVVGQDGLYAADVLESGGIRRLQTSSLTIVDALFGVDDFADVWFALGTFEDGGSIGSAGDTVRVQIAAGNNATNYPAVDYTYTIQASDVAAAKPELAVRDGIIEGLNLDSNFSQMWKAIPIKENGIVYIYAKYVAEVGERPTANDFQVTTTGTQVVTVPYDTIVRRNKTISTNRDLEDPRYANLGVYGTVETLPSSTGRRYFEFFVNGTPSNSLRVNGSSTQVEFTIPLSTSDDIFIQQIRIFGGGNGIKFGQFLSKNTVLTNGILVEMKSDDETIIFEPIKSTEDFKNIFTRPTGSDFRIDVQAGGDQLLAVSRENVPLPLRKQGTFTSDDYMKIIIRDDLTSGLTQLQAVAIGFRVPA